jgi:hypothetical protein
MIHFEDSHAVAYGITEAILINKFQFWIRSNKANNLNFYDGRTWSYNSVSAFKKLLPFLSDRQIRLALERLIDKNVLVSGNYNKLSYDRTLWYAFKDESIFIPDVQNGAKALQEYISHGRELHFTQASNPFHADVKSISHNDITNTINETIINNKDRLIDRKIESSAFIFTETERELLAQVCYITGDDIHAKSTLNYMIKVITTLREEGSVDEIYKRVLKYRELVKYEKYITDKAKLLREVKCKSKYSSSGSPLNSDTVKSRYISKMEEKKKGKDQ